MTDPTPRVLVRDLDELGHGVLAVADDVRRHALGDRDHPPADHEDPVVAARDEATPRRPARDAPPSARACTRTDRSLGPQVEARHRARGSRRAAS